MINEIMLVSALIASLLVLMPTLYVRLFRKKLIRQLNDILEIAYVAHAAEHRCSSCLTPAHLVTKNAGAWDPFLEGDAVRKHLKRRSWKLRKRFYDNYVHCPDCDIFYRKLDEGADAAGVLAKNWSLLANLEFARLLTTLEDVSLRKLHVANQLLLSQQEEEE